jgi:deoxyuridine 5'-triphosphate nucleotidohydrolase
MEPTVEPLSFAEWQSTLKDGYILYLQVEDKDLAANLYYNFKAVRHSNENAGYDLLTAETWCEYPGENAHLLNLGVRAMLVNIKTGEPSHYWLLPRSSIYKTGYIMANSVGVIDSSYRGILKAPVMAVTSDPQGFTKCERHFQIVAPNMGHIQIIQRVESLPSTARGDGGFGSTGL